MRSFQSLDQREILALAIAMEEEDARIYDDFAEGLRDTYPKQAEQFRDLRRQENGHRHRLLDLFQARFGEHVPHIRREDIRGFVKRRPVWMARPLGLKAAQRQARLMELETKNFYETVARRCDDAALRQLLGDLAEEERGHVDAADAMTDPAADAGSDEHKKQLFALQVVQPGLVGLMDGSVSTLAPLFAAAFATHNSWQTFLVGLAAGLGAGISMGFAEALSDDGTLTGRGHPWIRGAVCGLMTTVGGLGHTLPYLIRDIHTATAIAIVVVFIELMTIAWVRHKYMDTPWTPAILQVILGGALVFFVGILIGKS